MVLRGTAGRLLALLGFSLLGSVVLPASVGARTWSGRTAPVLAGSDGSEGVAERPLVELAPAADAYLAGRAGSVGVAIAVPGRRLVYSAGGGVRFRLASLAKLGIMATVMDRAIRERRELTFQETALLGAMIERSDNTAADMLWQSVGSSTVRSYLHTIGLTAFQPGPGLDWGASEDTAADIARLLAGLADGSLLDGRRRALALVLLSRVDPSQRWGITAGLPAGALLAFKNGWVQTPDGAWRLHSAGVVLPGRVDQAYAVVVLTEDQPSLEYGVQTIEQLAQFIHADVAASR